MKSICVALALTIAAALGAENITVYFSPNGGCTDAVVGQLNRARASVLVQAYSFTPTPIAETLVAPKRHGIPQARCGCQAAAHSL